MRIEPISVWRPAEGKAETFASLPYDVFDRAEAASYVQSHPGSFLAIDRPETAFGPEQDMYAPEVYAKAAELIRGAALDRTIVPDEGPCLYLYRLRKDGHSQTGLVCACSVDEYDNGTIRRHENTRRDKEQDRIDHIRATDAQTGPIFLAYRDMMALDILVSAASSGEPVYDFVDEKGVRQTVWRVARPAAIEAFAQTFKHVPCAYIADGHHRAASAVAVCKEKRAEAAAAGKACDDAAAKPEGTGFSPAYDGFLAVLFPASQLTLLPYNRVVADTCGLGRDELLAAIADAGFEVSPADGAFEPQERGTFGMELGGSWWSLRVTSQDADEKSTDDPVARLDTAILQDRVLGPILGIGDPRTDPRISFVGGVEGAEGVARRAGEDGVGFTLFPTSVDELMDVSDAGMLMPPKSTWFEPKLLSGLFIRRL